MPLQVYLNQPQQHRQIVVRILLNHYNQPLTKICMINLLNSLLVVNVVENCWRTTLRIVIVSI